MKEYEVVKTVQLTFIIEADSAERAEYMAWRVDDRRAVDYAVYDIEVTEDYSEDEEE